MSLFFNGTEIKEYGGNIKLGDTDVKKVIFDGKVVWLKKDKFEIEVGKSFTNSVISSTKQYCGIETLSGNIIKYIYQKSDGSLATILGEIKMDTKTGKFSGGTTISTRYGTINNASACMLSSDQAQGVEHDNNFGLRFFNAASSLVRTKWFIFNPITASFETNITCSDIAFPKMIGIYPSSKSIKVMGLEYLTNKCPVYGSEIKIITREG